MKNEAKLKIAKLKKRKEQNEQELLEQQHQSQQKAQKELITNFQQAIAELQDTIAVSENKDLKELVSKLGNLDNLPQSFNDISSLSLAVSSKLERLLRFFESKRKPEFRIQGLRNLIESIALIKKQTVSAPQPEVLEIEAKQPTLIAKANPKRNQVLFQNLSEDILIKWSFKSDITLDKAFELPAKAIVIEDIWKGDIYALSPYIGMNVKLMVQDFIND